MPITLARSTITLGDAVTSLLRPAGTSGSANAATAAKEHIRNTMLYLNNRRNWTWLQNVTNNNVTTDGLITLATRFKKIYGAYTSDRALTFMDERSWKRQNPTNVSLGGMFYYIPFNTAETGKIEIVDHPAITTNVTVAYIRLLELPTNNASVFDVPESVMDYILNEATKRYLVEKGAGRDQIMDYRDLANAAMQSLILDDAREPDNDTMMVPGTPTDAWAINRHFANQWID